MASLYELTAEYQQLIEAIESGEIPEEAIEDTLEAIEGELTAKIDNIACIIKNCRSLCEEIKAEADRLTERRRAKERECEHLERYITLALDKTGMQRMETARNKISFRSSQAVKISDEPALIEWCRVNAPEAVTVKEMVSVSKSTLSKLMERIEIPFAIIEKKKNLQLK